MKIFFISRESNAGDLALRLGLEGNEVKYFIAEKDLHNLDGLIEKEKNWRAGVNWADLVVFDDSGLDEQTAYINRTKKPAFGMARSQESFKIHGLAFEGHTFAGHLEKDRNWSQEVMESYKVGESIESLSFKDLKKALDHLKSHKVAHVIKPEVDGSGSEKTYVGHFEDNKDAIGWLETLPQRPGGGKIKSIEIQERAQGVEVGCSAYFNGKDFIGPVEVNFEHKKIATGPDGGLGFNTGEMGTILFYDRRDFGDIKLFNDTLNKMGDFFAQFDFRGQIDINCIVNEDGIWPLEFTPRLGFPASYIQDELQETKWTDLLYAVANGETLDNKVSDNFAIGVLLVGEGFPFWKEGHERMDGMPIYGLTEKNFFHTHPYDLAFKDNRFIATGCYPLTATGNGKTVKEAQDMVYNEVIPQIYFPGIYYRVDIGDMADKALAKLKDWGYNFMR